MSRRKIPSHILLVTALFAFAWNAIGADDSQPSKSGGASEKIMLRIGETRQIQIVGLDRCTVVDGSVARALKIGRTGLQVAGLRSGSTTMTVYMGARGVKRYDIIVGSDNKEPSATGDAEKAKDTTDSSAPPKTDGDSNSITGDDGQPEPPESKGSKDEPLRVGDTVIIEVTGEPDISRSYTIDQDGDIVFPAILPKLKALDLTIDQLKKKVAEAVSEFHKDPQVTVRIEKRALIRGTVMMRGHVQRQGSFTVFKQVKVPLNQAIDRAGPLPDADLERIQILSPGNPPTKRIVNLLKFLKEGDLSENPNLEMGEIVTVPARGTVFISGAVSKPGYYSIPEGEVTLARVLIQLGGGPLQTADLRNVSVRRSGGQEIKVNLREVVLSGDPSGDAEVNPGDIIFVPALKQIRVIGRVTSPKIVYISEDTINIMELLNRVGGPMPDADLNHVSITKENGETSEIDIEPIVNGTAPGTDAISLEPGDTLYMPKGLAKGAPEVWVAGEVAAFGKFVIDKDTTLATLLPKMQIKKETADLENVEIIHADSTKEIVNVKLLEESADFSQDRPVRSGDRIVVKRAPIGKNSVLVMGAVGRPGYVPIVEGLTAVKAIFLAGGPQPNAKKKEVKLYTVEEIVAAAQSMKGNIPGMPAEARPPVKPVGTDPATDLTKTAATATDITKTAVPATDASKTQDSGKVTEPKGVTINLEKYQKGDSTQDHAVKEGDVIYVPEGRASRGGFRNILSSLFSLRYLFFFGRLIPGI